MVAAISAVSAPTIITICATIGACANSTALRPTMYTPAVTIVAAWMSADTGVGPSIASGSQTYSGICALLPVAPTNSSRQMSEMTPNCVFDRHRRGRVRDGAEVERAERVEDQEHAEHESPVADAVDDERLLAGIRRALLFVPVPDEQVRAQAHAFPPDEHRQEGAAQHEHQA